MKSEPTLRQIDYDAMAELDDPQIPLAALYLAALENLGVLVPVEPDIGAAYTAAIDRLIHLDEYGVKAIVDAALGIGGDE